MLRKQLQYLLVFSAQAFFSQCSTEDWLAKLHNSAVFGYEKLSAIQVKRAIYNRILEKHKEGTIELTDHDKRWIEEQLQRQLPRKYQQLRMDLQDTRYAIEYWEERLESEYLREQKQA